MTMNDFAYEPDGRTSDLRSAWDAAIGLQEVDGLRPSKYLRSVADETVSGSMTMDDAGSAIRTYYREMASRQVDVDEMEADLVSHRITELLTRRAFVLAPSMLFHIHRHLFQDLDGKTYRPGLAKAEQLAKKEAILNGDSVLYGAPEFIDNALAMLFDREAGKSYGAEMSGADLSSFCDFIAHVWQVHPFNEGNTRTVAVFSALYLDYLGFDVDNAPFSENSRYFRDALVRATYRNAQAKVMPDSTFIERFFDNMLHGAGHEMRSRDLICQPLFDDPSLLRNMPAAEALNSSQLKA